MVADVNITLSSGPDSTLLTDELLGLPTATVVNGTDSYGEFSLDLRQLSGLGEHILEVRVVGFDSSNNAVYSDPRYFEVRNRDRVYAEMLDPGKRHFPAGRFCVLLKLMIAAQSQVLR